MKYLIGFVAAVAAVIVGGLIYVYSGAVDVAASRPHGPVSGWLLPTAMRRAVQARADAPAPARFTAAQVQAGFREYDEECVLCHGAPGVEPAEWAQGMRPAPPDLARTADRWTASELHWIVRNGVRMTGMPAMGEHHSPEDIWSIVAFVQTLPRLTPEAYRRMRPAVSGPAAPPRHVH